MKHSEKVYIAKQAAIGTGTLVGALYGLLNPDSKGDRVGGTLHGAGRGLGFDAGAALGGGVGAGIRGWLTPRNGLLAMLAGIGLGGYGGYRTADKLLDNYKGGAPYDK